VTPLCEPTEIDIFGLSTTLFPSGVNLLLLALLCFLALTPFANHLLNFWQKHSEKLLIKR